MDRRRKKKFFSYLEKEELEFTEKDRVETVHKIRERKYKQQQTLLYKSKRYIVPVFGTVTALILAIILLFPNLDFGNEIVQENPHQATQQEHSSFSILILGKDTADETNRRNSLNILLTYNSHENNLNVVYIPRNAYVEVVDTEGDVMTEDKLIHASAYGGGPEAAVLTVSNLLDITIDYYAVNSEERIYEKLGIGKADVKENRKVISDMGELIKEELTAPKIKMLLEESSVTNISSNVLNMMEDMDSVSTRVIDMAEGAQEKFMDGIYYLEIDPALSKKTSQTLNEHVEEN
ncbi:LCP family glycopolymer transferase [Virgibacillus kimchii]